MLSGKATSFMYDKINGVPYINMLHYTLNSFRRLNKIFYIYFIRLMHYSICRLDFIFHLLYDFSRTISFIIRIQGNGMIPSVYNGFTLYWRKLNHLKYKGKVN